MANNTPVVSIPDFDLPAKALVNTLNGSLLPTLNDSPSDDVETVSGEEVAD